MKHIINYGFKAPTITPDQYVRLGTEMIPKISLQKNKSWLLCLPAFEKQFNESLETFGCTCFGTASIIEMLLKIIDPQDTEENLSDRALYIFSETNPPGNDPHIVGEAARHAGMVKEEVLPFSKNIVTLDAFQSLENREQEILSLGKKWTNKYCFLHEWIIEKPMPLFKKQKILMEYLEFSPIGVSVRAWQQRETGLYYKETGEQDTHWCVLVGFEEGKHWIIYDSYPNSEGEGLKYLEWDYDFGFAKRYHLSIRTSPPSTPVKKLSLWERIINFIKKYI